jgi:RNA polymerase sigma-70 factor (ECF subfamily)
MLEVSNGDVGQLGVLFDRHHRQLFGFFVRMTGSPAVSEDLVQDVFLRILKYRKTFRPDSQFSTWMYQIARNARIDDARKRGKDHFLDEAQLDASGLAVEPADTPRRQEADLVRRALADLPAEKRELLVLARFQGLRHKEIGKVLGCDTGTVKVRVFRAIQELRRNYLRMTGEKVLWNAHK